MRASLWARAALPKYAGFGDSVRRAQQVNIKMDWGGRMRRIGAPCTAVRVGLCVCVKDTERDECVFGHVHVLLKSASYNTISTCQL